ncbi:unnamed protein product [Brassica oleracea var. botrytis]|uniref:Uncharacterized protein n=2 Tax=Brassica TaxID=3705 RepID=A0A3P6DVK5_BRAOL|nr:unnamed protein product [Brassica napus]VDD35627.1 unnamed protein product [Brassica oleracea]
MTNLKASYAKKTFHVVEANAVDNLSSQMSELNLDVNPPASRRPPGRHRKNCQRINVTRKHNLCSRCKGSGHNKATFKMVI